MKLLLILLASGLVASVLAWKPLAAARQAAVVMYPEGYRDWTHVKSSVIRPSHARFSVTGGFQHVYANPQGHGRVQNPGISRGLGHRIRLAGDDRTGRRFQRGASTPGGRDGEGLGSVCRNRRMGIPALRHQNLKKDGLVLSTYRQ